MVVVARVGTREGDVLQVQWSTSRSVPLRLVVNSCHIRIPAWLGLLVAEEYPISVILGEIRKLSSKVLMDAGAVRLSRASLRMLARQHERGVNRSPLEPIQLRCLPILFGCSARLPTFSGGERPSCCV